MNTIIKNILGVGIGLAVLALAYGIIVSSNSFAQFNYHSSENTMSVEGEGKVTALPDVAEFSYKIISEGDKDLAAIVDRNSKKTNVIDAVIKADGVDDKDISTTGYDINPRYQYYLCTEGLIPPNGTETAKPCPPPVIVGYTVTKTEQVKARDFSKVGKILSDITSAGANSISGLYFTIDDPSKLEDQAKSKAIASAKVRAQSISEAAGISLGNIVSITASTNSVNPIYVGTATTFAPSTERAVAPTIQPGSQEIRATAEIRFAIR